MSVFGNTLMWGKGNGSSVVGVLQGSSQATTAANRGTWRFVNDDYATESSNILTLSGAGSYTLTWNHERITSLSTVPVSGSYTVTVYHNNTALTTSPATITASAGDTIRLQSKSTPTNPGAQQYVNCTFTLSVEKAVQE